jgi:hypothetical protein
MNSEGRLISPSRELGLELEGRTTIEGEWPDESLDLAISASRLP